MLSQWVQREYGVMIFSTKFQHQKEMIINQLKYTPARTYSTIYVFNKYYIYSTSDRIPAPL